MPISRVRCVTTKDITPYRPTSESSSASVPKLPESVASMRSVFNDRLTCSSERAEVGDRQCRIGVVNDRSNRLESAFGRAPNPHVEVAASAVALEDRKVRLLRLLAKTAIAEVRHDADDFDVRVGVGPGTLTDAHAERTAPSEVSFRRRPR